MGSGQSLATILLELNEQQYVLYRAAFSYAPIVAQTAHFSQSGHPDGKPITTFVEGTLRGTIAVASSGLTLDFLSPKNRGADGIAAKVNGLYIYSVKLDLDTQHMDCIPVIDEYAEIAATFRKNGWRVTDDPVD